jgi:hypothetical protein
MIVLTVFELWMVHISTYAQGKETKQRIEIERAIVSLNVLAACNFGMQLSHVSTGAENEEWGRETALQQFQPTNQLQKKIFHNDYESNGTNMPFFSTV